MQYRKFGKLDWQASILGFGTMRLPLLNDNPACVDESEAIRMIRYAIDHGVNYIDTAYPYHGGRSEVILGLALDDGYKEKVKVATKLPPWNIQSVDDCDRHLDEQLSRLKLNKLDFYLLHGLNRERWPKLRDLGIIDWAERAIVNGRFDYFGFSFHDDFAVFKGIIDDYDNWTMCQIQYNFMDENFQAGTKGLKYASARNLAIVVMEPLRGGRLTKRAPPEVMRLWDSSPSKRSLAAWGLLWVWNHPEVTVALSGMNHMDHIVENLAIAEKSGINILTQEDLSLIAKVKEAYKAGSPIPCTGCGYCLPCPNGIKIPVIFDIYNDAAIYHDTATSQFRYSVDVKKEERADQCTECRECTKSCPQSIDVPEWLKKAQALLGTAKQQVS